MTELRDAAVKAAVEAGRAILEVYHSSDFDVTVKGDNSPLTRADIASHEVIMEHLAPLGIPVLSEEGRDMPFKERKGWSELWIVDPIDGTKEFIKRNGEFTVNIALARDGVPIGTTSESDPRTHFDDHKKQPIAKKGLLIMPFSSMSLAFAPLP